MRRSQSASGAQRAALLSAVLACHCHVAGADVYAPGYNFARPDLHAIHGGEEPPYIVEPPSRTTNHLCFGRDQTPQSDKHASCDFRHMCVVPSRSKNANYPLEFIYVHDEDNLPGQKEEKEIGFTVAVGPHSVDERVHITPNVTSLSSFKTQFPTIRRVDGLTNLFYEYNGENFGHFLTDVLLPLYTLMDSFNAVTPKSRVMRYRHPGEQIGWSCDFQVSHWAETSGAKPDAAGLLTGKPGSFSEKVKQNCITFYKKLSPMISEIPITLLDSLFINDKRPVCFDRLLVGAAMNSDDCLEGSHGREGGWSLCNQGKQSMFWRFRHFAKHNLKVKDRPPTQNHVVIWKRSPGGYSPRPPYDCEAIKAAIEQAYPGTPVTIVAWEKHSIQEQLKLAGNSTVHITQPGGGSFIATFLPRGATTIRLYTAARDYPMEFHYFNYLGYIHTTHLKAPAGNVDMPQLLSLVGRSFKRWEAIGNDRREYGKKRERLGEH